MDSIFLVEDSFSKMDHFLRCKRTSHVSEIAGLFFKEVHLHGIPRSVTSYGDTKFLPIYGRKYGSVWTPQGSSVLHVIHKQMDRQR